MDQAARVVMREFQGDQVERKEEAVVHTEHSLVQEAKSWDHLLAQMADWKERERSWNEFRKRYESGGKRKTGGRTLGRLA